MGLPRTLACSAHLIGSPHHACTARPGKHAPCPCHSNLSNLSSHFSYCRPRSSGGGGKDGLQLASRLGSASSKSRRFFRLPTKLPQRSLARKDTKTEFDSPRGSEEEENIEPFSDWALHRLLGHCQVHLFFHSSCIIVTHAHCQEVEAVGCVHCCHLY